jgi:KDO2-lipid IV(A) lauroyltransferase
MTLAARLVLQTGATVIVARCERKSWGRGYTLYLEELPVPESQSLEATVADQSRHGNHHSPVPQQYLWGYGRYKQPREDKQLGEKA